MWVGRDREDPGSSLDRSSPGLDGRVRCWTWNAHSGGLRPLPEAGPGWVELRALPMPTSDASCLDGLRADEPGPGVPPAGSSEWSRWSYCLALDRSLFGIDRELIARRIRELEASSSREREGLHDDLPARIAYGLHTGFEIFRVED